ncbi:unnamed protein product [Symbiodinium sp. CCMP2592]|nr:unnamed protein product [Symbiodinium sp. CCMP2592]
MFGTSRACPEIDFEEALRVSWQQLPRPTHKLPWEHGAVGFALGKISLARLVSPSASLSWERPVPVPVPSAGLAPTKVGSQPCKKQRVTIACFRRCQMSARPGNDDQDARRKAVVSQRATVLLVKPDASWVGRTAIEEAVGGHVASANPGALFNGACCIVEDITGVKSTATLLKRLGSVRRFMAWCQVCGEAPFPYVEFVLCGYVRYLRDEEAAATAAQSFVEAVRFSAALFGIDGGCGVVSKRISGIAATLATKSGPIKQAPPLTAAHVRALEQAAVQAASPQDRLWAGSLLILLYARCRFGDGQRATSWVVDMVPASSSEGFIELTVRHFKTATSVKKKRQLLPVVAPMVSLTGLGWFEAWLAVRAELGLPRDGSLAVPLLPCFSAGGLPTASGLTSTEGGAVLRALLEVGDESQPRYTSHSLKATLLSWAAKYGIDLASRRLLGYHLDPSACSAETYARDALAAPLRLLVRMLDDVREGRFDPDATRSGMISALPRRQSSPSRPSMRRYLLQVRSPVQLLTHQTVSTQMERTMAKLSLSTEHSDQESDCSSGSDSDFEPLDDEASLLRLVSPQLRPRFLRAAPGRVVYRHDYSGIYHIGRDGSDRLECGRRISDRFVQEMCVVASSVKCKTCFLETRECVVAMAPDSE